MQVDGKAAIRRDLAQPFHRPRAVRHGPFEMRDAAHHVHAHVERADQVFLRALGPEKTVLREGHQLQVDIGGNAFPDLQQRLDPDKGRGRHVHVAADRKKPLGHRQIAIPQRALHHRVHRQKRFQLPPERDPLQERARQVEPRLPEAERGIHVEMRIDERR
jgi:hypothetical protein